MTLNSLDSLMRLVWICSFSVGIFFITYPDFINAFIFSPLTHEEITSSDGYSVRKKEYYTRRYYHSFTIHLE
ncbi:hypothetical protein Avbf_02846 [Armadillidium vulgare]|nr:hypothetical protein Avbf_02846 [Armadillidium vulgare]